MDDVYTRIGYIKGATGATGAQGAKGDTGDAATIQVGSVTTVPYGQTANVVNSGTEQAAVFDFTIPQGRPGQQTTEMDNLLLDSITTSSASFPIPTIGETGKVLWGKVVKWFSDMSALVASKFDASHVINNLTTTASGYALDARQGKALNDNVNEINAYSPTFDGDTSKIETFSSPNVFRVGKLVIAQLFIRVIVPNTTSPGELVYSGIPPAYSTAVIATAVSWDYTAPSMIRCYLSTNGQLFVRGGVANKTYDVRLIYFTQ